MFNYVAVVCEEAIKKCGSNGDQQRTHVSMVVWIDWHRMHPSVTPCTLS